MSSPERIFDNPLIKDHIRNLQADNEVMVGCNTEYSTDVTSYFALVMPKIVYLEKLSELNARYFFDWQQQKEYAETMGIAPPAEFEPVDKLDDLDIMDDPGYAEADSLLGALSGSLAYYDDYVEGMDRILYYDESQEPTESKPSLGFDGYSVRTEMVYLHNEGYVTITRRMGSEEYGQAYGALVINNTAYIQMLNDFNAKRYEEYDGGNNLHISGKAPDFKPTTELDDDTIMGDPRFVISNDALEAVYISSDIAKSMHAAEISDEYFEAYF